MVEICSVEVPCETPKNQSSWSTALQLPNTNTHTRTHAAHKHDVCRSRSTLTCAHVKAHTFFLMLNLENFSHTAQRNAPKAPFSQLTKAMHPLLMPNPIKPCPRVDHTGSKILRLLHASRTHHPDEDIEERLLGIHGAVQGRPQAPGTPTQNKNQQPRTIISHQ